MVVPEEATLLMEGVAKGGYPLDISQSSVDLTSLGQSELGCASALIESGLEPGAVAQFEVGYAVLERQESYRGEEDFASSLTEVMRPMEMAELVDILPTLTLIDEETPRGPSTPSVLDMLESFGLGIGESNTFFEFEDSAGGVRQPDRLSDSNDSAREAPCGNTGTSAPTASKGAGLPQRNQVEWDRPADGSS